MAHTHKNKTHAHVRKKWGFSVSLLWNGLNFNVLSETKSYDDFSFIQFLTVWMGYDAKDREYNAQTRKIGKYLQQSSIWAQGQTKRIPIHGLQRMWYRTDPEEVAIQPLGFLKPEDDEDL